MRLALSFVTVLAIGACGRAEPAVSDNLAKVEAGLADTDDPLSNEADRLSDVAETAATLPPYLPMPVGGEVNLLSDDNGVVTANITAAGSSAKALDSYEAAMRSKGLAPRRQTISRESGMLFSDATGRSIQVTVTRGPAGNTLFGIIDRPASR